MKSIKIILLFFVNLSLFNSSFTQITPPVKVVDRESFTIRRNAETFRTLQIRNDLTQNVTKIFIDVFNESELLTNRIDNIFFDPFLIFNNFVDSLQISPIPGISSSFPYNYRITIDHPTEFFFSSDTTNDYDTLFENKEVLNYQFNDSTVNCSETFPDVINTKYRVSFFTGGALPVQVDTCFANVQVPKPSLNSTPIDFVSTFLPPTSASNSCSKFGLITGNYNDFVYQFRNNTNESTFLTQGQGTALVGGLGQYSTTPSF